MATDYDNVYRESRHALGEPTGEFMKFFDAFPVKRVRDKTWADAWAFLERTLLRAGIPGFVQTSMTPTVPAHCRGSLRF